MAKTWIVVADSARARFFNPEGEDGRLAEIMELAHPAARAHERELAADRPGRSFDSGAPGRHAMSESVSPKEHEAWKLCKKVADQIEKARARGMFDRLVIVAAPAFLGALRKELSAPTARLIAEELPKDLVNLEVAEIRAHLAAGGHLHTS